MPAFIYASEEDHQPAGEEQAQPPLSVLALSGPAVAAETAEWLERRVGKVGEVLLMDAWAHL